MPRIFGLKARDGTVVSFIDIDADLRDTLAKGGRTGDKLEADFDQVQDRLYWGLILHSRGTRLDRIAVACSMGPEDSAWNECLEHLHTRFGLLRSFCFVEVPPATTDGGLGCN